jgi:hypothetical protein
LANFKVERVVTASAAPAGEVLAQEPAPAALGREGSTVILRVSDGSLATAASTDAASAPVTAPVTTPVTAAVASSTTAPAMDPTPATTTVPMLPQEPAGPPGAGGQNPTALSASAALMFGAGMLLGLLSGALLMRARLLRRQPAAIEVSPPPPLAQSQQPVEQQPLAQQPADQQPVDQQPVDQQPVDQQAVEQPVEQQRVEQQPVEQQRVDEHPVNHEPVDEQRGEQPIDETPVHEQPAESDASDLPQHCALSAIRFTARFVPGETTIVFAPFLRADEVSLEDSIDHHA